MFSNPFTGVIIFRQMLLAVVCSLLWGALRRCIVSGYQQR